MKTFSPLPKCLTSHTWNRMLHSFLIKYSGSVQLGPDDQLSRNLAIFLSKKTTSGSGASSPLSTERLSGNTGLAAILAIGIACTERVFEERTGKNWPMFSLVSLTLKEATVPQGVYRYTASLVGIIFMSTACSKFPIHRRPILLAVRAHIKGLPPQPNVIRLY